MKFQVLARGAKAISSGKQLFKKVGDDYIACYPERLEALGTYWKYVTGRWLPETSKDKVFTRSMKAHTIAYLRDYYHWGNKEHFAELLS